MVCRLLLCAVFASGGIFTWGQQAPGASDGAPGAFKQRLNTVVRKAEPSPNLPVPGQLDPSDPLSFYRQNPELMRAYFPQLMTAGTLAGASASSGSATRSPVLPMVKFDGGTAQELAGVLKATVQPTPNILIGSKMTDFAVPAFELHNVTLADLFQALNNLTDDKGGQWQLSGSTEPIWVLNPVNNLNLPGNIPAFPQYPVGPAIDPLTGQPIVNSARNCQILPVGQYLSSFKIEDITTAVKTAWSMMGDESGAQMKYHKDTNLLIVVGSRDQLGVLSQVLNSLEIGMHQDREADERTTAKNGGARVTR